MRRSSPSSPSSCCTHSLWLDGSDAKKSRLSSGQRGKNVGFVIGFARFWYDFIVGDDWTVAVGVVVALLVTKLFVTMGVVAWLWLPLAVAILLGAYTWRTGRR